MSLKVFHIVDYLNQIAPSSLAEKNDPIGLQIGSLKGEVTGILLTVDVTLEACKLALKEGINLIISHHPLIYRPLQRIISEEYPGSVVYFAIKEGVNVISWHTPLDKVPWGVSSALAEKLDLTIEKVIDPEVNFGPQYGLGVVAKLKKPVKIAKLANLIRKKFGSWVMVVGNDEEEIEHLAIGGGSCFFLIEKLRKMNINALLTSDVKYHDAIKAKEEGFHLLIIDHGVGEQFFLTHLKTKLHEFLQAQSLIIPLKMARVESPFKLIKEVY